MRAAYGVGKAVQFAFPLVCVWVFEGRLPRPTVPTWFSWTS